MARADALTTLQRLAEGSGFFRPESPVIYRTAHAALDVLGGLNAEAGGTIAQMPLPAYVAVAVQFDAVPRLRVRHAQRGALAEPEVVLALPARGNADQGAGSTSGGTTWLAGVGSLAGELPAGRAGASILIHSNIPPGAGQASSTALLAAVALALAEPRQALSPLAIAQRVAAAVAVARRGSAARIDSGAIVAALTCMHSHVMGKPRVLRYSAQPHRYVGPVPLPEDVRVLALDTGVREGRVWGHGRDGEAAPTAGGDRRDADATGGAYRQDADAAGVRRRDADATGVGEEFAVAVAMGLKIIETIYRDLGRAHTPLQGYLANVSPLLYRQYFRALLPRRMRYGDFVRAYGTGGLELGAVDKERIYRVRTVVDHLIAEHEHAEQFLQAMEELAEDAVSAAGVRAAGDPAERQRTLQRAGRLLLASHHSYRLRLELSCPEADWLVDRLMEAGPERGIYGARITGAGGGGTVAALLARSAVATEALLEVMNGYQRMTGMTLGVMEG